MSFKVYTWVLEHSEARLADRLVLLALAEFAHDDGTKSFPKLKKLERAARLSRSQTIASLKALEKGGAIVETGATRRGIKVYAVLMTEAAANLRGVQSLDPQGGAESGPQGVQDSDRGGAESGPPTSNVFEPSPTPQGNRHGRGGAPTVEEAPLSHLLADLIAANDPDGSRPRVGKTWADAERLLQKRDGRPATQIEFVIRWVQADGFEHAVVQSMPKLRTRYRELLAKAMKTNPATGKLGTRANTDADIERLEALKRKLEEDEGGQSEAA